MQVIQSVAIALLAVLAFVLFVVLISKIDAENKKRAEADAKEKAATAKAEAAEHIEAATKHAMKAAKAMKAAEEEAKAADEAVQKAAKAKGNQRSTPEQEHAAEVAAADKKFAEAKLTEAKLKMLAAFRKAQNYRRVLGVDVSDDEYAKAREDASYYEAEKAHSEGSAICCLLALLGVVALIWVIVAANQRRGRW